MKSLKTYFEELSTPANTTGMGNPGVIGPDTLSEPIERTAKSEVEKDKKKRKKKTKTLAESIFDQDLSKQDVYIGDVYELDEWTDISRNVFDVLNVTFIAEVGKMIGNRKWKKFTTPLSRLPKPTHPKQYAKQYDYNPLLRYLTELILCCETVDQIPDVLIDFLNDCRKTHVRDDKYIDEYTARDIQINVLPGLRDELIRMVVFKFKTKNSEEVLLATFKERD